MAAATGHMIITTQNKRIQLCKDICDMSVTAVVVPATAAELTASPIVN